MNIKNINFILYLLFASAIFMFLILNAFYFGRKYHNSLTQYFPSYSGGDNSTALEINKYSSPDLSETLKYSVKEWSVYEDDQVIFKYPSNWIIVDNIPDYLVHAYHTSGGNSFNLFSSEESKCNGPILIDKKHNDFAFLVDIHEAEFGDPWEELCNPVSGVSYKESRDITGASGVLKVHHGNLNYPSRNEVLDFQERVSFSPDFITSPQYFMGLFYAGKYKTSLPQVFDEIVKSFEYKNRYKLPSLPIEWNQFSSSLYNFSFEYPSYWGSPKEERTAGYENSGTKYNLKFPELEKLNTHISKASVWGHSNDYSPGGEFSPSDFLGFDNPKGIYITIGNRTTNCATGGVGLDYHYDYNDVGFIDLSLPDNQIEVRFQIPLLSSNIKLVNLKERCDLSQINERNNVIGKIENYFDRIYVQLDEESKINVTIFLRIAKTLKINN